VVGLQSSVKKLSRQEDEQNEKHSDHKTLQQVFPGDGWYYDGDEDDNYGDHEDNHHDGQRQTMAQGQQKQ
jgi:hypothetical protein